MSETLETKIQPISFKVVGLFAALAGPAISYNGVYLSHIIVAGTWISLGLRNASAFTKAPILRIIALSILLFAVVQPSLTHSPINIAHLAMVIASFATFSLSSKLANSAAIISRCTAIFSVSLIFVCFLEMFAGVRLPVSRYFYEAELERNIFGGVPPTGFYGNQNNLAAIIVVLMPLTAYLERKYLKWAVQLSYAFIILATDSRIIITCFALILMALTIKRVLWLGMLILGLGLTFVLFNSHTYHCHDPHISKFCVLLEMVHSPPTVSELTQRSDSLGIRANLAIQTWYQFSSNPCIGIGAGNLPNLIEARHATYGVIHEAHNPVLQIFAEYGVVGGALWTLGWLALLYGVYSGPKGNYRTSAIVTVLFLPILLIGVSTSYYFTALWALLGVYWSASRLGINPSRSRTF